MIKHETQSHKVIQSWEFLTELLVICTVLCLNQMFKVSPFRTLTFPQSISSMICLAVLTEYRRVTDEQTDRHTDRQKSCESTVRAMHGMASRGKNCARF